jgi:glucose 1-dehydrogenase
MHAIALISDTTRIRMVDRPEPQIAEAHQIKVRVLRLGICGTDRDAAAGGRSRAPDGRIDLVIGHELFGQVVAVGSDVTCVQPSDFAVLTVRRGCDQCVPCAMNRPDMCRTGAYRERGIWGLDGYQAEYVVEAEHYAVRVPPDLESIGVLTEPLAVAEKAIDEAVRLQSARLPGALLPSDWPSGRPCLVAGLGPIGLLVALVLRLRGAEVYGLDIVDPGTARPQWLAGIGGRYVDGRHIPPVKVKDVLGPMDLIVEATGVPALAPNGRVCAHRHSRRRAIAPDPWCRAYSRASAEQPGISGECERRPRTLPDGGGRPGSRPPALERSCGAPDHAPLRRE